MNKIGLIGIRIVVVMGLFMLVACIGFLGMTAVMNVTRGMWFEAAGAAVAALFLTGGVMVISAVVATAYKEGGI